MSLLSLAKQKVPTQAERETVWADRVVHEPGFKHKALHRLTVKRLPKSSLNIECAHFLRNSTEEAAHGHNPLAYKLWLEAGKQTPALPAAPDEQYNSNVWRNF